MTYANLKIRKETHRRLKVLSAKEGLTIMDMLDKLMDEYEKGGKDNGNSIKG